MEPAAINEMNARIFQLLADRMDAKGATLQKRLSYVQRALPGRVRRAGAQLVEAQKMTESPRLAMQVDGGAVKNAYTEIEKHLKQVDTQAERSRRRFNLMSAIAAQVLLVGAAMIGTLIWLGYL